MSATRRFGLPRSATEYLRRTYRNTTTRVECKDRTSAPIPMTTGVRQGDPLSPLLFNMVIDELLDSLPPGIGVALGTEMVTALAFADDLILMSSTPHGMKELLKRAEEFYAKRGLAVNPKKSVSLCLIPDGMNKGALDATKPLYQRGGADIKTTDHTEVFKCLGIEYIPSGNLRPNIESFKKRLGNLGAAALKPHQKLYLLRSFLVPSAIYGLSLGRLTKGLLQNFDLEVRRFVKKTLRLPASVSDSFLYADVASGGLGVPCLTHLIALSLRGRAIRLESSKDPTIRALVGTERYQRFLDKLTICLNDVKVPKLNKPAVKLHWSDELHQSTHGKGLQAMRESPETSRWVLGASNVMSGATFTKALQLRSNTLPCGATANRQVPSMCRFGCKSPESLPHLLQSCHRTYGLRIDRHNRIV